MIKINKENIFRQYDKVNEEVSTFYTSLAFRFGNKFSKFFIQRLPYYASKKLGLLP